MSPWFCASATLVLPRRDSRILPLAPLPLARDGDSGELMLRREVMQRLRVLFVCIHNSARSQMAEAFLKQLAGDRFDVESAGLEPGSLNPRVVEAMKETGIDISGNHTKSVDSFLARGVRFDFVITVCDETAAERCPVFPGPSRREHWGFRDPGSLTGTDEDQMKETRAIRDQIRKRVWLFIKEHP
jgi:arsenate reductase (thioredoxin)